MKNLIFMIMLLGAIGYKANATIITCIEGQAYNTTSASYEYQPPFAVLTVSATPANQSCTPPEPPPSGGTLTNEILCLNGNAYVMSDGFIYYANFFEIPTAIPTNDTCAHYLDEIFTNGFENPSGN